MKRLILISVAAVLTACGGGRGQPMKGEASLLTNPAAPPASVASTPSSVDPSPAVLPDPLDRSRSLGGADRDNNGVRDDVDAWITAQGLTAPQKMAVVRMAQTMQQTMTLDTHDKDAARALANQDFAAIDCVRSTFEPGSPKPNQLVAQVEALAANTRERAQQYIKYNGALNGMAFEMPATPTCK